MHCSVLVHFQSIITFCPWTKALGTPILGCYALLSLLEAVASLCFACWNQVREGCTQHKLGDLRKHKHAKYPGAVYMLLHWDSISFAPRHSLVSFIWADKQASRCCGGMSRIHLLPLSSSLYWNSSGKLGRRCLALCLSFLPKQSNLRESVCTNPPQQSCSPSFWPPQEKNTPFRSLACHIDHQGTSWCSSQYCTVVTRPCLRLQLESGTK